MLKRTLRRKREKLDEIGDIMKCHDARKLPSMQDWRASSLSHIAKIEQEEKELAKSLTDENLSARMTILRLLIDVCEEELVRRKL